jgi:hypothetical protein
VGNLPRRGIEMIWIEMRADRHTGTTLVYSQNTNGDDTYYMRVHHVANNSRSTETKSCDRVENQRH